MKLSSPIKRSLLATVFGLGTLAMAPVFGQEIASEISGSAEAAVDTDSNPVGTPELNANADADAKADLSANQDAANLSSETQVKGKTNSQNSANAQDSANARATSQTTTQANTSQADSQGKSREPQKNNQPNENQAWYRTPDGRFYYYDAEGKQRFESEIYGDAKSSTSTSNQSQRPLLGVRLSDTPNGVVISSVQSGSPAAQAGLRVGDRVMQMNGDAPSTASDLASTIASLQAGETIQMRIDRNGQMWDLNPTLAARTDRYQAARPNYGASDRTQIFDNELNEWRQDFDRIRRDFDALQNRFDARLRTRLNTTIRPFDN